MDNSLNEYKENYTIRTVINHHFMDTFSKKSYASFILLTINEEQLCSFEKEKRGK